MSVISCDLKWEENARIEQTRREWNAMYSVLMSAVDDGPREIYQGLPKLQPYQPHPKDPQALVAEFYPVRLPGTNFWDLSLRYSTDVEIAASPLALPAVISIDSVKREIPALYDADGNVIVNMAGDFYTDPPTTRTITDLVFKFQKNLPLNLPQWITTYPDCVNSDTVVIRGLTCLPGTLYFGALSIGPEENIPGSATSTSTLVQGQPYTSVQWELDYRRDGWTLFLPNWGYFQLVPVRKQAGGTIAVSTKTNKGGKMKVKPIPAGYRRERIIVGPVGDYPSQPIFLDINGAAIINPTPDQIVVLEYDLHDKLPFSGVLPMK